jgi:hypothetical protein
MIKSPILAALAASALISGASATTLALPNGSVAVTWDTFTAATFANAAPVSNSGQAVLTLSSTSAAITAGGGDRMYSLDFTDPGAQGFFNLTIQGTINSAISASALVLKFTAPDAAASANFFNITANGTSLGAGTLLGEITEGANTFGIYSWAIGDLAAGDALSIAITSPRNHVSLDAIQIVPEPTSGLLAAGSLGLLLTRRRRA